MTKPFSHPLCVVLAWLLAACSRGDGVSTTPAAADAITGADVTTGGPATRDATAGRPLWSNLDRDARLQLMTNEVMPLATELFQAYDGERFAVVTCATCHGAGAADGSFAMPNAGVLPLHPSGSPEQQAMVQAHPQMVRFMFNRLLPAMRDTMNVPAYDSATGEGFSCFYCHSHANDTTTSP